MHGKKNIKLHRNLYDARSHERKKELCGRLFSRTFPSKSSPAFLPVEIYNSNFSDYEWLLT